MSHTLRWGIIGAGIIAHKFADAVKLVNHNVLATVASKDTLRAENFARQHHIIAESSYQTLVERSDLDIVYIATTHNFHYENALLALRHGKHVLVEKPFTVNAEQARTLVALAREKQLFLMEAIWVRFLPTMQKLKELLSRGVIGDIKAFNLSFGGFAPEHYLPRLVDPELAGGVTLDMGIYPITFINYFLGALPTAHKSFARMSDRGVDEIATYQFQYDSGCLATVITSFNLMTKFEAMIYGAKGYIEFPRFQEGNEFHLYIHNGMREIESCEIIKCDHNKNGFIYQIKEIQQLIQQGKLESPVISLDETIQTMALMDSMRADWGFRYPCE